MPFRGEWAKDSLIYFLFQLFLLFGHHLSKPIYSHLATHATFKSHSSVFLFSKGLAARKPAVEKEPARLGRSPFNNWTSCTRSLRNQCSHTVKKGTCA